MPDRRGITLVELLVVLVVLGLGTALVAPALIFPETDDTSQYARVLEGSVELAAAREQVVRLVVEPDGRWRIPSPNSDEPLAEGRFEAYGGPPFTLSISPLGSCGPEPGSAPPFDLDLLTCTVP